MGATDCARGLRIPVRNYRCPHTMRLSEMCLPLASVCRDQLTGSAIQRYAHHGRSDQGVVRAPCKSSSLRFSCREQRWTTCSSQQEHHQTMAGYAPTPHPNTLRPLYQDSEVQRFGVNEALWPMAAGRATREALLSEAGFEKGASCFVDDLVSCWGKRGA